jgi:hypothetical protein
MPPMPRPANVYVTPSKTALVIDMNDGKETLSDDEVASLFIAAK